MRVYRSEFLQVAFFREQQIMEMIWLPNTIQMEEEQYKDESLNYLALISKLKPSKIMANTQELFFTISPDLQEWVNQNILAYRTVPIDKVAVVESKAYITRFSVSQTMEEREGIRFTTSYFESREQAWEWLVSI